MACDRMRPLLARLADGALRQPRRFFVARHAAHCPDCAARLEELSSIRTMLRTKLPAHRAPPGLAARIVASLPRESPPAPSRIWYRIPAFGVAGGGVAGALAGIALKVCWPSAPRWLGVPLYLLLGWVALWFAPTILHSAGVAAMVLLAVGGVFYSIGGVFYALRWPDPWPTTFGYHEVFHACTAVAAILHYIAMWFAVFYVS